jgi:hypothetical protein
MEVHIVWHGVAYEGDRLVGVYADLADAKEVRRRLVAESGGREPYKDYEGYFVTTEKVQ